MRSIHCNVASTLLTANASCGKTSGAAVEALKLLHSYTFKRFNLLSCEVTCDKASAAVQPVCVVDRPLISRRSRTLSSLFVSSSRTLLNRKQLYALGKLLGFQRAQHHFARHRAALYTRPCHEELPMTLDCLKATGIGRRLDHVQANIVIVTSSRGRAQAPTWFPDQLPQAGQAGTKYHHESV